MQHVRRGRERKQRHREAKRERRRSVAEGTSVRGLEHVQAHAASARGTEKIESPFGDQKEDVGKSDTHRSMSRTPFRRSPVDHQEPLERQKASRVDQDHSTAQRSDDGVDEMLAGDSVMSSTKAGSHELNFAHAHLDTIERIRKSPPDSSKSEASRQQDDRKTSDYRDIDLYH